jgi:hypothetical protein
MGVSSTATAEPTTPPPMTTMRLVIRFSILSIAAGRLGCHRLNSGLLDQRDAGPNAFGALVWVFQDGHFV